MALSTTTKSIIATVVATAIGAGINWGFVLEHRITKIESQQDISVRVANLENMLTPVLVEYRMREELQKRGINPLTVPGPQRVEPAVTPADKLKSILAPIPVSPDPTGDEDVDKAKSVGELKMVIERGVKNEMKVAK